MQDEDIASLKAALEHQERRLRVLSDRQEILDCSHRFCRGINRLDEDLLRSAFHPDAIDDHGIFTGGVEGFVEWIRSLYGALASTQHYVTNQSVELDGDVAHAEQYWFVANVFRGEPGVALRGGRYVDRFERRDGRWAIAARACIIEWNTQGGDLPMDAAAKAMFDAVGASSRDRSDLSYQRPLRVRGETAGS